MKKYLPTISIFIIAIGIVALGIWYSDKNSPIKELAKLDVYSKEELSFLEKEGFLDDIDLKNLPDNKEQIISLLKSPNLIEQNLNSPDESFVVLATKLGKDNYQLAFKLENKSNESREFFLIPVSESDQLEFQGIKGVVNNRNLLSINKEDVKKEPLESLYDIKQHKKELNPQLAQAYDDIDHNSYQAKPIKITLAPNSTLLAKSEWKINRDRVSDSLEPVYLLVYGSAGGVKDELTILNVHSSPKKGENWEVEFTTKGIHNLTITPNDQATIDDDEFTGLYCDNEKRTPQILENDVIYYPNWECNGTSKVVHYTKKAGNHVLRFEFGEQTGYAYNSSDVIGSLVGYWKLDEVSGDVLDAHGINDGAAINGAVPGVSGILNDAYVFDGTDSIIDMDSGTGHSGTDPISIQAWIFPTSGIADGDRIFEEGDEIVLYMNGVNDIVWLLTDMGGDRFIASTGNLITLDAWNHVVATFDGTKMHLYINGVEFGTGVTPTGVYTAINQSEIGARRSGASISQEFIGRIDEVGVWNKALTQSEVTSLYNSGAGFAYPFVSNSVPTITSVSDYPDPIETGNTITFSVDWNDADTEGIKMLICKTNAITAATPSCDGGEWSSNKNDYDSTDPIISTYTVQSGDVGSNDYYAFVCDDEPTCSSSTSGSFTVEAVSTPSVIFKGGINFKGGTTIK